MVMSSKNLAPPRTNLSRQVEVLPRSLRASSARTHMTRLSKVSVVDSGPVWRPSRWPDSVLPFSGSKGAIERTTPFLERDLMAVTSVLVRISTPLDLRSAAQSP